MGLIHTFILSSVITQGEGPRLSTFIRRLVHFFHNSFVLDGLDEREMDHLPSFSSMNGVKDLFSLYAIVMFLNVLDERTYRISPFLVNLSRDDLQSCQEIFDLNAIPVVERYHNCYIRGLLAGILRWFFERYSFSDCNCSQEKVDGHREILEPFLVHIGRHIVRYKRVAVKRELSNASDQDEVEDQVRSVLFYEPRMREEYLRQERVEQRADLFDKFENSDHDLSDICDLEFYMANYTIEKVQGPLNDGNRASNFLSEGQTLADRRFFAGVACEFDLNKHGLAFNMTILFQSLIFFFYK